MNIKRIVLWLVILPVWLWTAAAGHADGVKARLVLKNKKTWEVELIHRRASEWVRMKRGTEQGEINFPVADVAGIVFALDLKKAGVDEAVEASNYKEAAAKLKPLIEPTFRYLDIPNNAMPHVIDLAKYQYMAKLHGPAIETCDALISRTDKDPEFTQARLYKVVALIAQNKVDEATEALSKISPPPRKAEGSVLYWYASAHLQTARKEWAKAQESAAHIVAFYPKDFEWMPAGLFMSARGYISTGSYEVVDTIIKDLKMVYSESRWTKDSDNLKKEARQHKAEVAAMLEQNEEE